MLHKMLEALGYVPGKSLEEKEQEISVFMNTLIDDNRKLMEQNTKLMEENKEMKEKKKILPLKVLLRSTRKRRPWCWGPLIMLMAFIQAILVASGKQRTARRHLIALLKELEYHYGFRFLALKEGEESDERKG